MGGEERTRVRPSIRTVLENFWAKAREPSIELGFELFVIFRKLSSRQQRLRREIITLSGSYKI